MQTADQSRSLEEQIEQWRSYLRRRQAIHSVDITELEDHLREQVGGLMDAGLATDEAFLVDRLSAFVPIRLTPLPYRVLRP